MARGRRPPKAFLEGGELAHEFYVAHQLKMTVRELRERMSNYEFVQWTRYFAWVRQSEELASKAAAARIGG
jgi:hypothetical protein